MSTKGGVTASGVWRGKHARGWQAVVLAGSRQPNAMPGALAHRLKSGLSGVRALTDVGPWVLDLARLEQHIGHDLVQV